MTDLQVRRIDSADLPAWQRVLSFAFGGPRSEEEHEQDRELFELERTLAAYDGTSPVATAGTFSFSMTVPGGPRPVAGVTAVAVLSTYRRRGVLTSLMRHQLTELHERELEPVAALWASEPAIYGRFGYGAASRHLSMTIPRSPTALAHAPEDPSLELRLVPLAESVDLVESCYARYAQTRPGFFARDERWARAAAADLPSKRFGASERRCVVASDPGGVRGYVRYATVSKWAPAGPDGIVRVRELLATDPAAHAALWRYVLDIDLMGHVETEHRPLDDPLLELLADPRRAVPVVKDGLFCRLADVDRALGARGYSTPIDVVFEVQDDFCPWNARRFRLSGDDSGAACEPTTAPPDLSLSALELGSAYLGGISLRRLAAAGRVSELRPGALAAASAAFAHDPLPWCPAVF
ncbi:MAG: GNAT family N-acetyltransferase [Actinomycetota bacterium]|nr:GNAT family N-acetyltransferase [Actinomycetota bacterium]